MANSIGTAPVDGGSSPEGGSQPFSAGDVGRETVLQSASIGKLAEALSKAQGEIKAPSKSKTAKIPGKDGKPGFEYRYADLADVIECYKGPLSKAGLSLVQPILQRDGHLVLVTRLLHSSGEWLASEYPLTVYAKPQEQGSAISYARRYAVTALLGIMAEDDDDGQRAQDAEPVRRQQSRPKPAPAQPSDEWQGDPPKDDAGAITDLAFAIAEHEKVSMDQVIREASSFKGDDGKERFFTDPTKVTGQKWLSSTRRRLEDMHRTRVIAASVASSDVPF